MINAKELRIGNYVKNITSELSYSVIFGITNEYPYLNEITAFEVVYENLEEIPITEEWLLRFGFEKTSLGYFKKDDIILVVEDFYYECLLGSVAKILKYIHQLQNLYFVLTGKELELKE